MWFKPLKIRFVIISNLFSQFSSASTIDQFIELNSIDRLNVSRLLTQFNMKQLVRFPTRGDQILDLVLTNLPQTCDKNGVEILLPLGLSDHNVVLLHPCQRSVLVKKVQAEK